MSVIQAPEWTDEQVERLKKLWTQEIFSAADIAGVLGKTKNAVIGKIHRMKLEHKTSAIKPHGNTGKVKPQKVTEARDKSIKAKSAMKNAKGGLSFKIGAARRDGLDLADAMEAVLGHDVAETSPLLRSAAWEPLPGTEPVALDVLAGCKWPVSESPFLFCNSTADGIYCPAHAKLAKPKPIEARK